MIISVLKCADKHIRFELAVFFVALIFFLFLFRFLSTMSFLFPSFVKQNEKHLMIAFYHNVQHLSMLEYYHCPGMNLPPLPSPRIDEEGWQERGDGGGDELVCIVKAKISKNEHLYFQWLL